MQSFHHRPTRACPWLAIVTACFLPTARASIDFTLHQGQVTDDQISSGTSYLTDGPIRIYLSTPLGWRVSSNVQSLALYPPTSSEASARIEELHAAKMPVFDEAGYRDLRQQALALLPKAAQEVQVLLEEKNPVAINGWTSFEVTHGYTFFGRPFTHSTLYLNLGDHRMLRITAEGPRADFPKFYPSLREVLYSWVQRTGAPDDSKTGN